MSSKPRVQAIVVREGRVLMVKHRMQGEEWWCLPGGALEPGETPEQGTLRELREECNVNGIIIRRTSVVWHAPGDEAFSYLVDIADQEPSLGHDPDVAPGQEVLADVRWLCLCQIPERDRAFLWAAGLLGTGSFLSEVEQWGDRISYPGVPDASQPLHPRLDDTPDGWWWEAAWEMALIEAKHWLAVMEWRVLEALAPGHSTAQLLDS
jgi:8-oxo-dGTP diphosphatase